MKKSLAVVSLMLSACGDQTGFKASSGPAAFEKNNSPEITLARSQYLNLVGTDQVAHEKNESVLESKGGKIRYVQRYLFNSGNAKSLKIMQSTLTGGFGNCNPQLIEFVLKGSSHSRKISVIDQPELSSQTDYVLEASFPESCTDVDATLDLTVWAGEAAEDPKIAIQCKNQLAERVAFFTGVGFMEAYTYSEGTKRFLNDNVYCGERATSPKASCSVASFSTDRFYHCSTNGPEGRSYDVSFDSKTQAVAVTCKAKGEVRYSEALNSCQLIIKDFNTVSKIP